MMIEGSPVPVLMALGDPGRREALLQRLNSLGIQVSTAGSARDLPVGIEGRGCRLVVVDAGMADLDLEVVLRALQPSQIPLILLGRPSGRLPAGADLILPADMPDEALAGIIIYLLGQDQRLRRARETSDQLRMVFDEAKDHLQRIETAQQQGERRQHDLRQRFHRLIDANPAVIYATEVTGEHRCLFVSRRFKDMLGYEPRLMLGNNSFWLEHIHPGDRPRVLAEIEPLIAAGGGRLCYRFRHASGAWCSLCDDFAVLRDSQGRAQEIIGCWNDISTEREAEGRFDTIFQAVPDGILLADATGVIRQANPALARIFGYPDPAALEGRTLVSLLSDVEHAPHAPRLMEFFTHPGSQVMGHGLNLEGLRADGGTLPIEITLARFPDPRGGTDHQTLAVVRDVTERREQARRIDDLIRAYAVLSAVNQAVIGLDEAQQLLDAICRIAVELGKYRLAWVGRLNGEEGWLKPVACAGETGYVQEIRVSAQEREIQGRGPIGLAIRNGDAVVSDDLDNDPGFLPWREAARRHGLKAVIALPLFKEGKVFGTLNLYSQRPQRFGGDERVLLAEVAGDLGFGLEHIERESRRRLAEARIEALAYHDELTGLRNRRGFLQEIAAPLAAGEPLALAVFDLVRLRDVNLDLGYELGDALLRMISGRLSAQAGDAVLGHLGASVFAVALPGVRMENDAAGRLEGLLGMLDQPFELEGMQIAVQYQAGLALAPRDGEQAETLLRRADLAKERGKGVPGIGRYRPGMEPDPGEQALLARLVLALDSDQFRLHFQPKMDLASGRITAVEALVRWRDPEHGLQPPGRFIPLLEKTGLMPRLTPLLLAAAATTVARWRDRGLNIRMAVNISAPDLAARGLPELMRDACVSAGIEAHALMLELTETAALQETPVVAENLADLHRMGIKLSIDDFGTGHASLSRLTNMPVSQIKIDQSFVTPMRYSPNCQLVVAAAIALGHMLGLEVVAEGIEDIATLAMIREMGCDKAQGYVISRPLPEAELLSWLEGRRAGDRSPGSAGG